MRLVKGRILPVSELTASSLADVPSIPSAMSSWALRQRMDQMVPRYFSPTNRSLPWFEVNTGRLEMPDADNFAEASVLPSGDQRTSIGPARSLSQRSIFPVLTSTIATLFLYQNCSGCADPETRITSCLLSGDQSRSLTLNSPGDSSRVFPVWKSRTQRRASFKS